MEQHHLMQPADTNANALLAAASSEESSQQQQYASMSMSSSTPNDSDLRRNPQPFNVYYNSLGRQWPPKSHIDPQIVSDTHNPNPNHDISHTSPVQSIFSAHSDHLLSAAGPSASVMENPDDDLVENHTNANNNNMNQRPSGACRQCKKLKTKCEFVIELNMCRRCKAKGRVCVFEGRKKTEHKHEVLIAQLRDKEATIDALLKQVKGHGMENRCSFADPDIVVDRLPNRTMQMWIRHLYERYPPDVNNNWTVPSAELQQQQHHPQKRKGKYEFIGAVVVVESERNGNDSNARSQAGSSDNDEDIEGGLPPLHHHPILLHHIPPIPAPLGYIADLHLRSEHHHNRDDDDARRQSGAHDNDGNNNNNSDGGGDDESGGTKFGIADPKYFHPGPASDLDQRRFYIEREAVPDMLMHGLMTMDDVDALFRIYFQRMNAFVSLLDPILHTPANTFSRCPFLFTIICAIASRYYPPKRAIYKYAMHISKLLAGQYLVNGWKTVELCQAYILLSTFSIPAKKWEEDRSRLYLELAIRIALDLNLHQPLDPKLLPTEKYERESLNRTRTWLNCYNLDCSMSTLLGRPAFIDNNVIGSDMAEWYTRSPYNHSYDVHLCAYTETMQFMCRFHEAVRGGGYSDEKKRDLRFYKRVTLYFSDLLDDMYARIAERYDRDSDKNDSGCVFRTGLLPLVINYYRLVMFSFGFQQSVDQGALKDNIFFQKCFDAACAVITSMIDILAPTSYMRFSPDGYFIFAAFAAAFLLKLLRPDFTKIVKRTHKDQISTLVRKFIRFLGSPEVAVDDQHTPKLYSRFLAELFAPRFPSRSTNRTSGAVVGELPLLLSKGKSEDEREEKSDREQGGTTEGPLSDEQRQQEEYEKIPPDDRYSYSHLQDPKSCAVPSEQDTVVHVDVPAQPPPQNNAYEDVDDTITDPSPSHPPLASQNDQPHSVHIDGDSTWRDAYMVDETMTLPALTTEEYISSMQAISNPRWWENVMMPGFSWPPASAGVNADEVVMGSQYDYQAQEPELPHNVQQLVHEDGWQGEGYVVQNHDYTNVHSEYHFTGQASFH